MKSVLLADDHPMFRTGMRRTIEDATDYLIVGEASDGETCISQAALLAPDIIVVDLSMPTKTGFEIAEWAREHLPDSRLVVVSMYSSKEFVQKAKDVGAAAFVAKEDAGTELIAALTESEQSFFMSSSAGREETFAVFDPDARLEIRTLLSGLTRSEVNVLTLVAQAMTSQDISNALNISVRTVDTHRHNICVKLNLHGPNSLLQFALQNRVMIIDQQKQ